MFIDGFAKNQQSNLSKVELKAIKKASKEMLGWKDKAIDSLVKDRVLKEITYD